MRRREVSVGARVLSSAHTTHKKSMKLLACRTSRKRGNGHGLLSLSTSAAPALCLPPPFPYLMHFSVPRVLGDSAPSFTSAAPAFAHPPFPYLTTLAVPQAHQGRRPAAGAGAAPGPLEALCQPCQDVAHHALQLVPAGRRQLAKPDEPPVRQVLRAAQLHTMNTSAHHEQNEVRTVNTINTMKATQRSQQRRREVGWSPQQGDRCPRARERCWTRHTASLCSEAGPGE